MSELKYKNEILAEREKVYGDPVKMHATIARLWSGILGTPVRPTDVALMMIAMKVARAKQSPDHEDCMIDIRGYSEIHDMIVKRESVPVDSYKDGSV